jgi:hypothetical protein
LLSEGGRLRVDALERGRQFGEKSKIVRSIRQ